MQSQSIVALDLFMSIIISLCCVIKCKLFMLKGIKHELWNKKKSVQIASDCQPSSTLTLTWNFSAWCKRWPNSSVPLLYFQHKLRISCTFCVLPNFFFFCTTIKSCNGPISRLPKNTFNLYQTKKMDKHWRILTAFNSLHGN